MSVEIKVKHTAVEIACLYEKYMSAKMKKVSGKIKTWHIVADIARVY
jgi:hypothetical protein